MHAESIREYAIAKENVTEGFPFGESTLVFKVNNKVFLLLALDEQPLRFNIKCDPDLAIELREQYDCVQPGYHMNKKHWNTIVVDGSVPNKKLKEWIDHSYQLIAYKAPQTVKKRSGK